MDYKKIRKTLVQWMRMKVEEAGSKGIIIGLSGGIDSSVVAALAMEAFPKNCFGLILPCHSQGQDEQDAVLLAEAIGIPYKRIELDSVYDAMLEVSNPEVAYQDNPLSYSNIKPRLRMTALYFEGGLRNYLVAGTGNKSEFVTGYFTKYGDGGVDIEPIGELLKTDVKGLARELGIPEKLITKAPTAGLWQNQTDEDEMGFTYEELDDFIRTGKGRPEVVERVTALNNKSKHKKSLPPVCKLGLEYEID
ncbi:NAD(+) synthase [Clostridia bacterium]|nr:NAD(+) synthase [Clostridia bacterium]